MRFPHLQLYRGAPKLYCCYHFVGDSDTFQHIRIEFSVASTGGHCWHPKRLIIAILVLWCESYCFINTMNWWVFLNLIMKPTFTDFSTLPSRCWGHHALDDLLPTKRCGGKTLAHQHCHEPRETHPPRFTIDMGWCWSWMLWSWCSNLVCA